MNKRAEVAEYSASAALCAAVLMPTADDLQSVVDTDRAEMMTVTTTTARHCLDGSSAAIHIGEGVS